MNRPKRKSEAQLQSECDAWNQRHPEGVLVSYESIIGGGESHRGKSLGPAQVVGGHSAAIWLEGKSGYVDLEHCKAIEQQLESSKPLSVLVSEAFEGWDQEKASEPMLKIIGTLATEGRFDEITDILNAWLSGYSSIPHINGPLLRGSMLKRVCAQILNRYVLKQPGVDENVAMDLWSTDVGAPAIRELAFKPGKLRYVVSNFVNKAVAESQKGRL